jgi:hypothetical protein
VVSRDNDAALPALERSCQLAGAAGDKLTVSYAVRHLGIADVAAGRPDAARERLADRPETSTHRNPVESSMTSPARGSRLNIAYFAGSVSLTRKKLTIPLEPVGREVGAPVVANASNDHIARFGQERSQFVLRRHAAKVPDTPAAITKYLGSPPAIQP